MRKLGIIFIITGLVVILMIILVTLAVNFSFTVALSFFAITLFVAGILIYLNSD